MAGSSGLISAGGSAAIQKLTTGDVKWGAVAVDGVVGAAMGGALGGGRLFAQAVARGRPWTYANLGRSTLGSTDSAGRITVQQGLTGQTLRETVRHETVHSVLTPRNPALAGRTVAAYEKSHLWRYAEEALAEGYGAGSLSHGLRFPLASGGYDLNALRIAAEATPLVGAGGAAGYGVYEVHQ
jgi:hypothetical protein